MMLKFPWEGQLASALLCTKCSWTALYAGGENPRCPKCGALLYLCHGEKAAVDREVDETLEPKTDAQFAEAVYRFHKKFTHAVMPCFPFDNPNGFDSWPNYSGGDQRRMITSWLEHILQRYESQADQAEYNRQLLHGEREPPTGIGFSCYETTGVGLFNKGPRMQSFLVNDGHPVDITEYQWLYGPYAARGVVG